MEKAIGSHLNKKRVCPHDFQDHLQHPKRTGLSVTDDPWSYIETFFRPLVREEVESKIESHFGVAAAGAGSEEFQLMLCFLNKISSIIFTNNGIVAKNGEPLQVALRDATNSNDIVRMNPLASAMIEFVVLNEEFGSSQREEEIYWSVSDFNKNVLIQRVGKRPLIVGNDRRVRLNDGVAFVNHLYFTDNSSWSRSKQFRLGARIIDEEILAMCPRIGEAVSESFRVMDHRGEVNKKHHPPRAEDELWRLEGIGRYGEYHKRLCSNGIKTVDDFVKAYQRDPHSLRKLLGNRVPNKTWKAMVDNALDCVPCATFNPSFEQISTKNEVIGDEACNGNLEEEKKKVSPSNDHELSPETFFSELLHLQDCDFTFEDYPWLLPRGEASTSYSHSHHDVENTNTCSQYFQGGSWTNLVPKPK